MSTSYKDYLIPPILVAIGTYAKGVFSDGFLPDSPILLMDVAANAIGYDVALLTTEYLVNRMVTTGFLQEGIDRVTEPSIQGLINGMLPQAGGLFKNMKQITYKAALFNEPLNPHMEPAYDKTFTDRFIDGFMTNIIASYLSAPLTQ